jgi:hypothetical protein
MANSGEQRTEISRNKVTQSKSCRWALRQHCCQRQVGLSQQEEANRMGVDRAYVSGLELGQGNPTVVTLWHAAQALGIEVHLLLKDGSL